MDSEEQQQQQEGEEEEEDAENSQGPDYNYLLSMPMWFLTKEKKDELCKQRDTKVSCLHFFSFHLNLNLPVLTELPFLQINELNTLKRKSPSDLWKEDLAAFSEELEVITEATSTSQSPPGRLETFLCGFPFFFSDLAPSSSQKFEAKEKESAAAIPVKKAGGRGKVVKVKQETMPTPQGRRVVPRVTSAMKAEANKKADKKGEAKRGKKIKVRPTLTRPDGGRRWRRGRGLSQCTWHRSGLSSCGPN